MLIDCPSILDASTIINIAATGRAEEILSSIGSEIHICGYVREKECLFLRSDDGAVEPFDIYSLIETERLTVCELTSGEEIMFLNYATQLDDGEAMSIAIAKSRQYAIGTDDRKAQSIARAAGLTVVTTPLILKNWAEGQAQELVRTVLRHIEIRARFHPPDGDPHYSWWRDAARHRSGTNP